LTFAHRAFWAAAIFFRAAEDIVFLFAGMLTTFGLAAVLPRCPRSFAHLARWAAAIRALPAALSFGRLPVVDGRVLALPPSA
jgi:hypothetical protein